MIKNVFLPERIGIYFLFTKRVIGIDIGKTHINAAKIRLQGKTATIEQTYEEKIETGSPATYNERAVKALKAIFARVGRYDKVHTALSSSSVIFKHLSLPFITRDKISMVINFEVEPLLPFSINDAVVDFIITKQIQEQQISEILVAAVQKNHIIKHLAIFEQAGIMPDVITVDLFALYGLYKRIPEYAAITGNIILLDLGLQTTRVAFIHDGQLRLIRTLQKGMYHIAKLTGEELKIGTNEALEDIIRFGIEKPDDEKYNKVISKILGNFWKDINFTLTSFTQTLTDKSITRIVLLGGGAQIKGLHAFITQKSTIPCELFKTDNIIQDKTIRLKNSHKLPLSRIIALSAALPANVTIDFNLRTQEFSITNQTFFVKQLISAGILCIALFALLISHYLMQVKKLSTEIRISEQEAIKTLRKQFTIPPEETRLNDVIEVAQNEVAKQRETWFAFSSQARASFLQYLLELATIIDKESLGFSINRISIAEGSLILKAQVKDYEALKILERELRQSKLFTYVEPQDNPSFTMKITLAPTVKEQA